MADSSRTVRKRINMSATPPARWTDEDRTLLWQLRQAQSHLTWTQLYNVISPRFPGRSQSAITQECQRMEKKDAKRRMQLIKDRRNDHITVSTPGKRSIDVLPDAVKGRLPKEPRLDDGAAEQSSDDGGDIEYDGQRQPSISRESPSALRPHENFHHSPSSVQSPGLQHFKLKEVQSSPRTYSPTKGVGTSASVQASRSAPDLSYHMDAPQPRPDGGLQSSPSQTPHTVSSNNLKGNREANHALGMPKSDGSTPQGNITPYPIISEGSHSTSHHHPESSHQSPQPPLKPSSTQPMPSQSPASHPLARVGEPNKQYIETLTGDQCLDGAVHLLARLTQIRVKESMAQGERLNENAALKLRMEDLESRLDDQSKQLSAVESIGKAKPLAIEQQMKELREELEKMREESKAASQRLDEVHGFLRGMSVAAKLFDSQSGQSMLPAGAGN